MLVTPTENFVTAELITVALTSEDPRRQAWANRRLYNACATKIDQCIRRYSEAGRDLNELWSRANKAFERGLETYDPTRGKSLANYVYWRVNTTLKKYTESHQRRERLPQLLIANQPTAHYDPEIPDINPVLLDYLDELPQDIQTMVFMRADDYSWKEIGEELGENANCLSTRFSRAMKRIRPELRALLSEDLPSADPASELPTITTADPTPELLAEPPTLAVADPEPEAAAEQITTAIADSAPEPTPPKRSLHSILKAISLAPYQALLEQLHPATPPQPPTAEPSNDDHETILHLITQIPSLQAIGSTAINLLTAALQHKRSWRLLTNVTSLADSPDQFTEDGVMDPAQINELIQQSRHRQQLLALGPDLTRGQRYQIRLGERAENQLFQQYERLIHQQINQWAHGLEYAFEAALDGFRAAISSFDNSSPFISWLQQKLQWALLDHKRSLVRQKDRQQHIHQYSITDLKDQLDHQPPPDLDLDEFLPGLSQFLESLTGLKQRLVHLFSQGWSWPEIGQALGLSPGAARSQFNRLRDKIRKVLIPEQPNDSPPQEQSMTLTPRLDQRLLNLVSGLSPTQWLALGLTTGILSVQATTSGLFMVPVYVGVMGGSLLLNQHRHRLTARIRASLQVALYSVFTFLCIGNLPAHALFLNRLDDILTIVLNVIGLGHFAPMASAGLNIALPILSLVVGGLVLRSFWSQRRVSHSCAQPHPPIAQHHPSTRASQSTQRSPGVTHDRNPSA